MHSVYVCVSVGDDERASSSPTFTQCPLQGLPHSGHQLHERNCSLFLPFRVGDRELFLGGSWVVISASCVPSIRHLAWGDQGNPMELQDGQAVPLEIKQSEQIRWWQQQLGLGSFLSVCLALWVCSDVCP